MYGCIYTNQKKKKSKKWEDGFISRDSRGVSLYNGDGAKICTSKKYQVEDDMLDISFFLVQTDFLDELFSECKQVDPEEVKEDVSECEEPKRSRTEQKPLRRT